MQAKRVDIAASKLKGPDDIDLRAIKMAAKLAEKARLAAAPRTRCNMTTVAKYTMWTPN